MFELGTKMIKEESLVDDKNGDDIFEVNSDRSISVLKKVFYIDETIERWFWFIEGTNILHREFGPAVKDQDKNGNITYSCYYWNGKIHRPEKDGPAIERLTENGIIKKEYWVNGKLHRTDGPAIEDSENLAKYYLVKGLQLGEDEFNSFLKVKKETELNDVDLILNLVLDELE